MQWFYKLQIRLLILLNPPKLFQKINGLEWYQNLLDTWVEAEKLRPQSQILEVGCATGALSQYLFENTHTPIGLDASKKMIALAQKNYKQIDFEVANAYDLGFKENTFDAVLSSSLINVLDDRQQAIAEMFRVCKVGGTVSILVPLKGFEDEDLNELQKSLKLEGFSESALTMWHESATKISLEEVKDLFEGYEVEVEEYLAGMIGAFSAKKQNS